MFWTGMLSFNVIGIQRLGMLFSLCVNAMDSQQSIFLSTVLQLDKHHSGNTSAKHPLSHFHWGWHLNTSAGSSINLN